MRILISIMAVGSLLSAAGCGHVQNDDRTSWHQASRPATHSSRQEVQHAIERFRRAMINRRPDEILRLSAPNLTFGHSNGVVQTREEFAEIVRSGAEVFKRVDLTKRHLTLSGDIAVERHHFSADIIYQGKLQNFELEVVEVWQKMNGWKLVARQALKV